MSRRLLSLTLSMMLSLVAFSAPRECLRFDTGWKFAFGDSRGGAEDFGYGTEYFNYWTKAASIHNEGPYSPSFDPDKWGKQWEEVCLPHDWVVELPFSEKASHSHGYKTVGPGYPQTSVGWYRKVFTIPEEDFGKSISLRFDGIFHSSQLWVNGFYLGREDDGYVSSEYDITQYLKYGQENVVAVRVDASQESGWFYEGAGIYRHAYLIKKGLTHFAPDEVFVHSVLGSDANATLMVDALLENLSLKESAELKVRLTVKDKDGATLASEDMPVKDKIRPRDNKAISLKTQLKDLKLWSPDSPYLYTVEVSLFEDNTELDKVTVRHGFRSVVFDPDNGLILNGERFQIKGVNLHQDHAGVGAAIPDELYSYRLERLRSFGCNSIRCSHNPASPVLLDLCDSLGFLVIDENRLMGVNLYHKEHLERMIKRDRCHPSVILWSVGNEEWGIEWNDFGRRLCAAMRDVCHLCDPTRMMTVATSSGPAIVENADVAGYNYILQNNVEGLREQYPSRCALGSEETTGCGTRGWYFDDPQGGRMKAIGREKQGPDSLYNCIERGWKFYHQRPWLAGLFYWTGLDYRGESNPLVYPATGSSFGILDYCGFYKDEAYYLKSWWTGDEVLHVFPHWNLKGHEGEKISLWVYSNYDEVSLSVNGRSLGKKKMPQDGHLEWEAIYKPGTVKVTGYKGSRKAKTFTMSTTLEPSALDYTLFSRPSLAVIDLSVIDSRSEIVPDACVRLKATIEGPAKILGVGNGDSAWKAEETTRSSQISWDSFNGHAQIIISSPEEKIGEDAIRLILESDGLQTKVISL